MKKFRIVIFAVLFLILISSCGGKLYDSVPTISQSTDFLTSEVIVSAHNSQIFFGQWETTEFIPGGRFSSLEKAEKYLGHTVYLNEKSIIIDGEMVLENPQFSCVLVAMEDRNYIWGQYAPDDYGQVLNLDSPYFAYILIGNPLDAVAGYDGWLNGFYILDQDTITIDTSEGLIRLTRLSYEDNYQNEIMGP